MRTGTNARKGTTPTNSPKGSRSKRQTSGRKGTGTGNWRSQSRRGRLSGNIGIDTTRVAVKSTLLQKMIAEPCLLLSGNKFGIAFAGPTMETGVTTTLVDIIRNGMALAGYEPHRIESKKVETVLIETTGLGFNASDEIQLEAVNQIISRGRMETTRVLAGILTSVAEAYQKKFLGDAPTIEDKKLRTGMNQALSEAGFFTSEAWRHLEIEGIIIWELDTTPEIMPTTLLPMAWQQIVTGAATPLSAPRDDSHKPGTFRSDDKRELVGAGTAGRG